MSHKHQNVEMFFTMAIFVMSSYCPSMVSNWEFLVYI